MTFLKFGFLLTLFIAFESVTGLICYRQRICHYVSELDAEAKAELCTENFKNEIDEGKINDERAGFCIAQPFIHNGQNYSAQCITEIFRIINTKVSATKTVAKMLYCSTPSFAQDEDLANKPIKLHSQPESNQICFSRSDREDGDRISYEIFCFCKVADKCNGVNYNPDTISKKYVFLESQYSGTNE